MNSDEKRATGERHHIDHDRVEMPSTSWWQTLVIGLGAGCVFLLCVAILFLMKG